MTTKKEDNLIAASSQQLECCMCGDSGLVHELFQCQVCHFRSQHRYCSNQYPKAESYKVCNWCLNIKEDSNSKDQKSQNSCNSSASCKENSEGDSKNNNIKKKRSDQNIVIKKSGSVSPGSSRGSQIHQQRNHSNNLKLQVEIKKPKSPPQKSPSTPRKRIITNARLEEKLRRTKSEEISNSGLITRHVFRNKVRRYKLLDEVSS
ncbi:hypothetical protein COLO4_35193 [Corchorus olitorius]|uniref:PHD-type zinc finger plants domain-containing protein n=1 Tax=Corchorus olitorius TaxID=93759 RepID=A0A1R3GHT6_9ROSI|nr:hypothetical protein COLO4_35193 [Corchorus olitorius]